MDQMIASITFYSDKARGGKLYKQLISDSGYPDMKAARKRQQQRKRSGGEFVDGYYVIRRPEIDEAEFQKYIPMTPAEYEQRQGVSYYNPETTLFDLKTQYPQEEKC